MNTPEPATTIDSPCRRSSCSLRHSPQLRSTSPVEMKIGKPMTQDAEGNWQLTLYLEPGKWAYKCVQDGRWLADPAAQAQIPDGSGGMNSLLQVGPPDPRYQPRPDAHERGTLQTLTVTSRRLGAQQLLIYRSAGSNPKKPLPWALMLHGYGMDRQQWMQAILIRRGCPSTHFYCGSEDRISTATNQRLEQQLQAAGHSLPFQYAPGGHIWHYWQALMPQIMQTLSRQLQPAPLP